MTSLTFGRASNVSSLGVGLILLFGVCALLPGTARGQAIASIKGTVYDTSGGVVPDATVILHSKATNLDRTTSTNSAGIYVIPDIQPGDYDLKISKAGFKSAVEANVTLVVNQTATFDVTLATGSVTESVTVAAEAVALETSTSELGVAVVKEQVNALPLNGRNFTQLLSLTPGVSTVNVSQNSTAAGGVWSNPIGTFSYPSINGQTNRSNLYLLDGLNNEGSFGSTYAIAPILDAIQEFKVQSHNDEATYGGALGGIINVVTKSGTTQYHATLWEFLRNTNFDARNPFLSKVTPFQQNQFGVAGGGPLSIPWGHFGIPKTFFFAAYEGFRLHTAASSLYNVPTPSELGGDLTTVGGVPFAGQIFNPFSSTTGTPFLCNGGNPVPDVNGDQGTAGTPCNKIPADMLDPHMIAYANAIFPAANRTPTASSPRNAQDVTKSIVRQDEFSARLDHQFTTNDNIFGRWSQFRQPDTGSGGFTGLSHFQITNGYTVGVEYLHTFSSSSLLETHFGRVLLNISQGSSYLNPSGATGASLGFAPNFVGSFIGGVSLIPNVTINGFIGNSDPAAHGAAHTDRTQGSNIWQFGGNFTKTYGRHTFKMGGDFATNNANALYLNGSEVFDSSITDNPAAPGKAGSSLASFLLGLPSSFKRRNVKETEHGGWVDGAFFTDSWRVTNKLTVNFGLRYDLTLMPIYGSLKDGNGFLGDLNFNNGTFILAHLPPVCAQTNSVPGCIPFGIGPGGMNPQPGQSYLPPNVVVTPHANGAIFQNDLTDFQPRVGFAYELSRNTVLRAAYGRFYDNWAAVTQSAQNYEGAWPDTGQLGATLNKLNTPPNRGSAEAPTVTAGNAASFTAPLIAGPSPFTGFDWYADPHMQRPYADQFNFGVQHQLGSSTVLTANYVGSRGHRLDIGITGNTGKTPSAVANFLPTGATTSSPYPYITPSAFDLAIGKSSYNALQASLNGRAFHGLTYLVSYTWSKTLDLGCTGWYGVEGCSIQNPYNLKNDKGPAGTDVPQIFSASWVYQLPFGKGQKYASSSGPLNYVVGGWTLNGIVSFSSGIPFFVGASGDIAHIAANTACCALGFGNYERLNFLGGSAYAANKSPSQWLNPAAFAIPAPGTFGNLGRDTLRSDRFKNLDLSLFKQFPIPITESTKLEFRFETFNLTNTPVWGVPDVNISDAAFGTISSTANTARQLQFGLKLYF